MFLDVSLRTQIWGAKIHQEIWELRSKIKWHVYLWLMMHHTCFHPRQFSRKTTFTPLVLDSQIFVVIPSIFTAQSRIAWLPWHDATRLTVIPSRLSSLLSHYHHTVPDRIQYMLISLLQRFSTAIALTALSSKCIKIPKTRGIQNSNFPGPESRGKSIKWLLHFWSIYTETCLAATLCPDPLGELSKYIWILDLNAPGRSPGKHP